jgi:cellulose synthase (UDP-forming)
MALRMSGVAETPCRVTGDALLPDGRRATELALEAKGARRDELIVKLYTGGYSQDVSELDKSKIAGSLWRRAFGRSAA